MTGLIGTFAELGGTVGSVITGRVFGWLGGQTAFYLSLVPMVLLALSLIRLRTILWRTEAALHQPA